MLSSMVALYTKCSTIRPDWCVMYALHGLVGQAGEAREHTCTL